MSARIDVKLIDERAPSDEQLAQLRQMALDICDGDAVYASGVLFGVCLGLALTSGISLDELRWRMASSLANVERGLGGRQ